MIGKRGARERTSCGAAGGAARERPVQREQVIERGGGVAVAGRDRVPLAVGVAGKLVAMARCRGR
jgi:hypothetical protein